MTIAVDLGRKATKQTNKIKHVIIQLLGHCFATRHAMSRSFVNITEIGTSWGRG